MALTGTGTLALLFAGKALGSSWRFLPRFPLSAVAIASGEVRYAFLERDVL